MAKQLNVVNLSFTADIEQAKRQLQTLQNQLTQITNTTSITGVDISQQLKLNEAIKDAAELKSHLQAATNINTGKLDFSKLNESLKKGNKSLTDYMDSLNSMGPAGQQAFASLAMSVANAEIPIRRSNAALTEMWTTLKNTARWQISSSILHGFMGAIQKAYGYAQDLNESLNNIRIVTGQSVEQMSAFAEKANKAAKSLSTTTTEYTKASLIYYQQGLSDSEVQARTDITIKMANAAGQSAEIVSDQLTAVWNNFYDGSKSLEYYADVMTALGAATASSTDEIAGGLEKFAAIGDTIGLSYEYAAAALATITSNTRQSEEVVGTALKTIFARIQGLKLGETLEDGTELNKYSEALNKVGISIFDSAGEMKKMDIILDEMAEKWGTLSSAQQTALAQTVAGVRQYTQLIALMENWNNGDNDSMMANLDTAYGSEGALQEQADIYAESWEAAQDRVTAAAEAIYQSLINDEAFIDLLNGFEKVLTFIDKTIDSVGGLSGVLTGLGTILTTVFHKQMAQGLTSMAYSFKMMTKDGRKGVEEAKNKVLDHAIDTTSNPDYASEQDKARSGALKNQLELQKELLTNADRMSDIELETNKQLMDRVRLIDEQKIKQAEQLDLAKNKVGDATYQGRVDIINSGGDDVDQRTKEFGRLQKELKDVIKVKVDLTDLKKLDKNTDQAEQSVKEFIKSLKSIDTIDDKVLDGLIQDLEAAEIGTEEFDQALAAIQSKLNSAIDMKAINIGKQGVESGTVNNLVDGLEEEAKANKKVTISTQESIKARKLADKSIEDSTGNQKTWSDHLVNISSTIMGVTTAISSLSNIVDTIQDPELSGWEKFTSIAMSLAMTIPMLTMAFNKEAIASLAAAAANIAHALGLKTEGKAAAIAAGETASFGVVLYSVLLPIGLVVAAIMALVGVIYLISEAVVTNEEAMQQMQEDLTSATEGYNKATEAVNTFKDAISSYDEGIKGLAAIAHETDKLKASVEDVNKKARELIETYGLFNDYTYGDFGEIIIDPEALSKVENDLLNQEQHMSEVVSGLNIASINLNLDNYIAEQSQKWGQYTTAREYETTRKNHQENGREYSGYLDNPSSRRNQSPTTDRAGNKKKGVEVKTQTLSETSMRGLAKAVENTREALGGIDPTAAQLIETIKNTEGHYGLTEGALIDLTSIINNETIFSIMDFTDHLNKATEAMDYYTNEFAKSVIEEQYGDYYSKLATDENGNVDQGLVEKMTAAAARYSSNNIQLSDGTNLQTRLENIDVSGATTNNSMSKFKDKNGEYYDIDNDRDLGITYATQHLGWNEADVSYAGGTDKATLTNTKTGETMELGDKSMRQQLARDGLIASIKEEFASGLSTTMEDYNKAMSNVINGAKSKEVANIALNAAGSSDGKLDANALVHQISPEDMLNLVADGKVTQDEFFNKLGLASEDLKAMGIQLGEDFTKAMADAIEKYDPSEYYRNMREQAAASAETDARAAGFDDDDVDDIKNYSKHIMEMAKSSKLLSDELADNAEAAADVAVYTARMNRGIETLADNFEDWSSVLKKSNKGSMEYSNALSGMKGALSDLLGVEQDFISADFVTEHMKDIELAANGDAEAINRLALAAAKNILIHVDFKDEEAKEKALALHDNLAAQLPNIEVGATLDSGDFMKTAQEIVKQAGMTAEQATAYFRSLGFETKFKTEEKDVPQTVPKVHEKKEIVDAGVTWDGFQAIPWYETATTSWQDGYDTFTGKMTAIAMSTDGTTPLIESITRTNSGSMNNYSSSNKGGKSPGSSKKSSSKPKKAEKLKKSDVVERYQEITDSLTDLHEEMDDVSRAADNLWGPKRWKQLEKNLELIDKEIELLKERKRQSESYLAFDKIELDSAARKLGFTVEYDEDGDVLNGTAIQEALVSQYNNMATSMGTLDEAEEEKLDNFKDNIDTFNEKLGQYRSSQQEIINDQNDLEEAMQKKLDERQTIFSEKWELEVELNDDELQRLDYYLSKTEDDFYQRAEGLAILGQQTGVYTQQLETQQAAWDELNQLKAEGKISDEFYMEQLDATKNSIYDNLQALQDLDKQMMEYYGETLQMASEEIDKVTDQMEHHNSVLEHYLSILELMGESANYKTIGVVLEGQAEVKKDRMIAAQQEWQTFQAETDAKYLAWKTATDEASAEMLKKQYEDALAISTEKQEEYLSLAEEYAESLKAILENSLKEYAQDLENALTGGTSFDQMNTKLERAAALQEEYLTTTNKIYETNKLMNTAQQEIDKTTNTIAKQRLKQFIDETNQLQKKNKLSKYELDIQQAKYDLLLAEIALEEAQNAKSSVRLQRDSEGNFGYVYTADQDKIAEAQQQLADAQNSLYNIALEGSNDYFTKYQETINEMYDYFTELHQQYLNGEFESEQEYQNAVAEAKAYYYELLEQYSDLYTIAISTDARALEDAWSSEFNSMVYNTKNWQTQVDIYIQRSQQSFSKYAKEIDTLAGELGVSGSYNEVANSVGNVVDQNEALLATLLSPGGVFDTMEMEIALVNDVCAAYAVERATVLELIKTYEALALSIMNVKRVEAGKEPLGSLNLPTNNAEQDTAVPGSAKAGDGVPKVGDRVKYNSGKYYNSSDGLSPTGTEYQGSEVYITKINTADWAKYPYHISVGNQLYKGDLGWLKLNQISGYDTGGYTGRWGSYGKLAMLHEKEIVLNKQDTENFLQSMELLDNIVKTIDLYSANQQVSGLLNSPSFGKLDSGTLEQKVTIDAHFPNVSSRVEIEEAFSTLINRASQYVNRN